MCACCLLPCCPAAPQTRDEVRVLSSLQHPNIVLYQECWQEQGFQYIAMEFCEVNVLARGLLLAPSPAPAVQEEQLHGWAGVVVENAPLPRCPAAPLPHCPTAPLPHCTTACRRGIWTSWCVGGRARC